VTSEDPNDVEPLEKPYFHLDLPEAEMVSLSYLSFQYTSKRDVGWGHPPGTTVSANRFAHGADVHITLEQTREFRDALTRALHKAGLE
jgi:hypothetical protein